MPAFQTFPNEILHEIIIYLVQNRWKQNHFNPARIKDLQTARLLCPSMSRVATPFLFENMVLDEKLCEDKDLNRLLIFAKQNPTLAGFVRRLQRKIVPCVGAWSRRFRACVSYELAADYAIRAPADTDVRASAALRRDSYPDGSESRDTVAGGCLVPKYCLLKQRALIATLKALPNVWHLESVPSVWYLTHIDGKFGHSGAENEHEKVGTRGKYGIYTNYQNIDFDHDIRYHLSDYVASRIFSLRLLPQIVDSEAPLWSQHLQHLRHLYLECSVQSWDDTQVWNIGFRRLKNLQSLKLSGRGVFTIHETAASCVGLILNFGRFGRFQLNDMLEDCRFPHLRCLTLTNWPVNEAGMIHLILHHLDVLQSVRLERLTLFDRRLADGHGWLRVAKAFGLCGRLSDVCLKELNYHCFPPSSTSEGRLQIQDVEAMYQEIRQNRPHQPDL